MNIYIERTGKTITKDFSGDVAQLLKELDILPDEVLVIKNGKLITEDEELNTGDDIRLLSVISGG